VYLLLFTHTQNQQLIRSVLHSGPAAEGFESGRLRRVRAGLGGVPSGIQKRSPRGGVGPSSHAEALL